MVPLAKILGDATEELAAGLRNDMLAGLLNATFGNVVELVLTVQTLRQGLFDVVKATLLGSVLSNLLLVLGMSFFCGGIVSSATNPADSMGVRRTVGADTDKAQYSTIQMEKVQHFGAMGAMVNISLLLLSCLSFVIVTIFHHVLANSDDDDALDHLLPVSRSSAVVVISCYVAYIVFQLGTHRSALADEVDEADEDGSDDPMLSVGMSVAVLFVVTLLVAFFSGMLVEEIRGVTEGAHMNEHFIGVVLLPIIGNACEHAAAVRFAVKEKIGLSISIAIGSSTQIALFAVPFAVLAGWCMDKQMDLNFGSLNTSVMTLSVLVVLSMVVDGQSNWLHGYLLMAAYVIISMCYWHLPSNLG
jgi:Ca2+:H+ antiporter